LSLKIYYLCTTTAFQVQIVQISNVNLRKSLLLFCLEKAGEVRVNDGHLFKHAAFPPALHAEVHNFSHRGLCSLRLPANSPKIKTQVGKA
jgi:hypothetical protein